jgi:phosphoglycerate dehydrogenase-like enzyme
VTPPRVVVAEALEPAADAWLAERADVVRVGRDDATWQDELAEAQGLVIRSYTPVDAVLLEQMPKLRVVGRAGVGIDHVDVAACRSRGVQVVHTPDANTWAVAEYVAGMFVRLVRPLHVNAIDFTDAGFKQLRRDAGLHVCDLTIGVLGMGRVGRAVTKLVTRGFGAAVVYHDVRDVADELRVAELTAKACGFDELMRGCDVLTVHVDGRRGNHGLIDAEVLADARFRRLINTSRGPVVDANAVLAALRANRLDAVALDVYDPEPPPTGSAYETMLREFPDGVVLTPHMASRTKAAVEAMSWVVRDVMAVLEGSTPRHPVR